MESQHFSLQDYEYYLELAQEINPSAYTKLLQCGDELGLPCIQHFTGEPGEEFIIFRSETTKGWPILLIDFNYFNKLSVEFQKKFFKIFLEMYNDKEVIPPLTADQRESILKIIESLAPQLYTYIIKNDPTGLKHIKRPYHPSQDTRLFLISSPKKNGLPIIYVGLDALNLPINEQRFALAHELGHYALGHVKRGQKQLIKHPMLEKQQGTIEFKKGKKVTGQLPFEKTFKNAWQRSQEEEADRFAIVNLGVDIDDAIALAKRLLKAGKEYELDTPEKETFKSTHPLWSSRIEHLNELRREVEIRKHRKEQEHVDWEKIHKTYLQN